MVDYAAFLARYRMTTIGSSGWPARLLASLYESLSEKSLD